jgi:hypothetical protein
MPVIKKQGVELSFTAEEANQLSPHGMDILLRALSQSNDPTSEQVAAPRSPEPRGSLLQAQKAEPTPKRRERTSGRIPRADTLPPGVDSRTRAKMMLQARPRSHRTIDVLLLRAGQGGLITSDLVVATGVSQSEVSRAISGLRRIEESAPIDKGTLLRETQEGRLTRWYAGPLLAELSGQQPEPSQHGAAM